MPEHAIQLRRGWEAEIDGGAMRIDLPAVWGTDPLPGRMFRRFNRPPIDADREAVFVRFEAAMGVASIALNGMELGGFSGESGERELPPGALSPSGNRLELTLDPGSVPRERPWGRIALVIRSR